MLKVKYYTGSYHLHLPELALMIQIAGTIFWVSFLLLLYTYVLYPLLLKFLSLLKKQRHVVYTSDGNLPSVSILIAAYNEELVIQEKIESILGANYPQEKIEIIIGSDNSTDATTSIVKSLAGKKNNIKLVEFNERKGKVAIINNLVGLASYEILILTDANVIFSKETVYELVKHFKNDGVGLVDSNMINTGIKKDGISFQEKSYIQTEVYIKNYEGLVFGSMMGPFGGCYAIRKKLFYPVPEHFLVDDFFINMKILLAGSNCINELNAKVYEDVSNEAVVEFKRKTRIAAGSFQNLFYFFSSLFRFNSISFCFFSHKVLRWLGPLLILMMLICSFLLVKKTLFFYCFIALLLGLSSPIIDYLFKTMFKFHFAILRFPAHFFSTNAAILLGLIRFLSGIKSGIWQPTKRHQ